MDDSVSRQPAAQALRALNADFCADIPQEGRAGRYSATPHDRFARLPELPVADGKYRVLGSGWVLVLRRGRLVEAIEAKAPHWGGKGVITVE